MTYSSLCWSFV